jgi:hypothetical protein
MLYVNAAVAWLAANPGEALGLILLAVSLVVGSLPVRAKAWPVVGVVVRVMDRLSALKMKDAPGTLSWPVIGRSVIEAAVEPPPVGAPPTNASER